MGQAAFAPAGAFALLLLVLASLPGDALRRIQVAPENPLVAIILSDPVMHFLTFAVLTLLLGMGFYHQSRPFVPYVKVAGLAFGYGFLIEVYQGLLPWRTFGLDDLVWNTVGVLFSVALLSWRLSEQVP